MDRKYIKRCIELAWKSLGKTYPNPIVGAVIVHNGKIIGEGFHEMVGEPHAEINAINSVRNKSLLEKSTIYVSLEPCSHFGRTPPCALMLKEIGFKKAVIGTIDPYKKVNGEGIKILEDAGMLVVSNVLEKESINLNKRFFTFHQKKRPFIILKWAESSDGFLDQNFASTLISNTLAKQWSHLLRARENAILVGKNTALNDNPNLTVREIYGRNPIRILIDSNLEIPLGFNIYNDNAPTLVFNRVKNEQVGNIKLIKIENNDFLQGILDKLFEEQIQSVIIEGGRYTLQKFIDAEIWDEAFVIKAPNKFLKKGTKAPVFNKIPQETKKLRDNQLLYFQNYK